MPCHSPVKHGHHITKEFLEKLSFNDDQIKELEKVTRSQSKSNVWWNQRIGRITAFRFGEVHAKVLSINKKTAKRKRVKVTSLVQSIVQPETLSNLPSLKWGRDHERIAAESFMEHEGRKHISPILIACGLYIYKPQPYIGRTPENIFTCACCEGTCIEYKCPYSIRDELISEAWNKTKFLQRKENVSIELVSLCDLPVKRSDNYYSQIQGQMAITGRKKSIL